jgi:hypothetical protein
MRMWMVDVRVLCRQHLLAEHLELHMFLGSINKEVHLDGYFNNDLFEPGSMHIRHDDLVMEMRKRGYNHKTPLDMFDVTYFTPTEINHKINRKNSLQILLSRCLECKDNYIDLINKGLIVNILGDFI